MVNGQSYEYFEYSKLFEILYRFVDMFFVKLVFLLFEKRLIFPVYCIFRTVLTFVQLYSGCTTRVSIDPINICVSSQIQISLLLVWINFPFRLIHAASTYSGRDKCIGVTQTKTAILQFHFVQKG